ncbi:MAG: hypothetical protein EWV89_20005 [Microcystis wesenbergii Mw_QC_B_20070930_S4]|nr:MAG: hypothetical protein EWV73_18325 [Microcystis wesenbergii Mw_QC_B_20070930_S4D]TRV02313.1 MAG: hypothetical protein EWV74_08930 [Microcystis wesenbergii Mw_QC_S_20081001_S30]TRV08752.1 MAG: hypothetical protein EWV89_20005 [Microcystis wesenbergii Mw_QC_B_20070930_S4]
MEISYQLSVISYQLSVGSKYLSKINYTSKPSVEGFFSDQADSELKTQIRYLIAVFRLPSRSLLSPVLTKKLILHDYLGLAE